MEFIFNNFNEIIWLIVIIVVSNIKKESKKNEVKQEIPNQVLYKGDPFKRTEFLKDYRMPIYETITTIATMLLIIELIFIGGAVGPIKPLRIKVVIICVLFIMTSYLFSRISNKIVGVELVKKSWSDYIGVTILSLFVLYFYIIYLSSMLGISIIFDCIISVFFVINIKEFLFGYILIWWNYFCGETVIYDQELIEIKFIYSDVCEITLKDRNKKFILNRETSLKLSHQKIKEPIRVDIMAKTSSACNVILITDIW